MYGRVSIPRDLLWKVRCFLASFANRCRDCLRRSPANCEDCIEVNQARELLSMVDRAEDIKACTTYNSDPVDERMGLIVNALAEAGRPIQSKSIHIEGLKKNVKCWTLRKMCRMGIIASTVDEYGRTNFHLTQRTLKRIKKGNRTWHST